MGFQHRKLISFASNHSIQHKINDGSLSSKLLTKHFCFKLSVFIFPPSKNHIEMTFKKILSNLVNPGTVSSAQQNGKAFLMRLN